MSYTAETLREAMGDRWKDGESYTIYTPTTAAQKETGGEYKYVCTIPGLLEGGPKTMRVLRYDPPPPPPKPEPVVVKKKARRRSKPAPPVVVEEASTPTPVGSGEMVGGETSTDTGPSFGEFINRVEDLIPDEDEPGPTKPSKPKPRKEPEGDSK